jgi:hypothetical protein
MANHESSTNATSSATSSAAPLPLYLQQSWLHGGAEHDANAIFAAEVMDIARGTRTIAGIVQAHLADLGDMDSGSGDVRPLLSDNDIESLARLALVSLDKLAEDASRAVDRFNSNARKGAPA